MALLANAAFIINILPVLDDLERAITSVDVDLSGLTWIPRHPPHPPLLVQSNSAIFIGSVDSGAAARAGAVPEVARRTAQVPAASTFVMDAYIEEASRPSALTLGSAV